MKAFRIKKRSHRQPYFISSESVTSFNKPKLPLFYFKKIHPPALFKRGASLPVVAVAMTQDAEELFEVAVSRAEEYRRLLSVKCY